MYIMHITYIIHIHINIHTYYIYTHTYIKRYNIYIYIYILQKGMMTKDKYATNRSLHEHVYISISMLLANALKTITIFLCPITPILLKNTFDLHSKTQRYSE